MEPVGKRAAQRLTAAAALGAELVEQALPVPRTQQERDYQAMIRSLCREQREAMGQIHQRYADALGYFTVWAHQIKTPIAAMRLRMQGEDSALARRLSTQITRVTQYVDMAMTYLRLESQSTDYVIRECALDDVVRAGVKTFAAEFIERKLALHYEPVHVRVVTDEKWLGFVIEQLLSNALKYTQHGGITIRMEDEDTLCIEDTGIGIAAEDMPRLFEQGFTGLNGRDHRRAQRAGPVSVQADSDQPSPQHPHGIRASQGNTGVYRPGAAPTRCGVAQKKAPSYTNVRATAPM